MGTPTYYPISKSLLNMDSNADCFMMVATGNGMINAGINDKDILVFRTTDAPQLGSIVAVEVDGQVMCRRYLKDGRKTILRRELSEPTDMIVNKCTFKGELQSLIRNFA